MGGSCAAAVARAADRAVQAAVRLPAEELASYAFHDLAQAVALLIPRLGRRVTAAVGAQLAGRTAYLEHGLPHRG